MEGIKSVNIKTVEITEEYLKDFTKVIMEKAKENLKKDKYLASVVFFLSKSQVYILPTPIDTEQSKLIIEAFISKMTKKLQPEAIIFLSDGWSISASNKEGLKLPPSKHPDRKECIALSTITKAHKSWGLLQFYTRENDEIKFSEVTETNENFCRFIDDAFIDPISKKVH